MCSAKHPVGMVLKSHVVMFALCGALWPMVVLAVFFDLLREIRESYEVQP